MVRSRSTSIIVKKKTGDAFDAILKVPPKIIPDAKMNDDGWWSFTGPRGKAQLKFTENKPLGILDHQYVDEEASWNVPMRVVSNGDFSEIIITLIKPDRLSDDQFDQRVTDLGGIVVLMKSIIESDA